jgi:transposase
VGLIWNRDNPIGDKALYATDLRDAQWRLVEPHLVPPRDPTRGGRPRRYAYCALLDAILYVDKTGCQWRMLPRNFPP